MILAAVWMSPGCARPRDTLAPAPTADTLGEDTATPYGYALDRDLDYYNTYYARWRKPLPTQEMVARALPEGVLQPGGKASGFLYFERVDEDLGLVHFRGRLVNAGDGSQLGVVEIPLLATEGGE